MSIRRAGNSAPAGLSGAGVRLGYSGAMAALRACPFCRKLFTSGEASTCPECDLALVAMSQLPPSLDALEDEAEHGVAQELEPLVVGQIAALVRVAGVREGFVEARRIAGQPDEGRHAVALLQEVVSHGWAPTLAFGPEAPL